jgi:hypothetical protein
MRLGRSKIKQASPPPGYTIGISAGQGYRTSSPVTARPMIILWISDVPSKIVKIVAGTGKVIGTLARGFRLPCAWGYRCPFRCRAGFSAAQGHYRVRMLAVLSRPTVLWLQRQARSMASNIGWWTGSILARCVPWPSSCCAPAVGAPTPVRPRFQNRSRCWPTSRCGTSPSSGSVQRRAGSRRAFRGDLARGVREARRC